jgi:hypothetical protein
MLAMYRRAAGQSENPLRPKTYNYFAGELMEQGLYFAIVVLLFANCDTLAIVFSLI